MGFDVGTGLLINAGSNLVVGGLNAWQQYKNLNYQKDLQNRIFSVRTPRFKGALRISRPLVCLLFSPLVKVQALALLCLLKLLSLMLVILPMLFRLCRCRILRNRWI